MIHQVVAAFMLGEGIVFRVIAYAMFRKKKAKLALCQRTVGEVIEVKEHHAGEGDPTKHPVIRYTAVNGETVTFESKFDSSNWKVKGRRARVSFAIDSLLPF